MTKKKFAGVLKGNPQLHRIHHFSDQLSSLWPTLRAEKFDAIIDLHNNLRSWRVSLALRRPTHRFNKLNWEKWLLVRFKKNKLPPVHIVDRYLAAAAPLGVKKDAQGLEYYIDAADELDGPAFLAKALSLPSPTPYIAVVIGAAHATKRMPAEKITEICNRLSDMPLVLLGGPDDQAAGATILANTTSTWVHNACGQLRLDQSASLVRQAAAVLTHDTGLMHIAAAFEKPIVSVWGNTVPDFGMYPYLPNPNMPNHQMEVVGLPCRPCSKIGHARCPEGHFRCMQDQSAAHIAEKILSAINSVQE